MDRALVFDAGVLALWFAGDRRPAEYFRAVESGRSRGLVSGVNLAEFYYKSCQKAGRQSADAWYYQTVESGLSVVPAEGSDRAAGLEKCRSPSLSLADCFALALARSEAGLLLTTDRELAETKDVRTKLFEL